MIILTEYYVSCKQENPGVQSEIPQCVPISGQMEYVFQFYWFFEIPVIDNYIAEDDTWMALS